MEKLNVVALPFGMMMAGREFQAQPYRYGFNGHENSFEIKGFGNSYSAEFWEYDSRIGRRWNIDPVLKIQESPYATFGNNPIWNVDETGADTSRSRYISDGQLLDAIKISYQNIKKHVEAKTLNLTKDYTSELDEQSLAYFEKHQNSMDFGEFNEFRNQVLQYHKGFLEVVSSTNGVAIYNDLGSKFLYNSNLKAHHVIIATYKLINEKNGQLGAVAYEAVNVIPFIISMSLNPTVGVGPRGPQSSNLNQAIVDAGALKLHNSVKDVFGADYRAVSEVTVGIKNQPLLKQLNASSKGNWVKVYEAGMQGEKRIEVHYFRNSNNGKVFDVKVKYDYWHQKPFKNLK